MIYESKPTFVEAVQWQGSLIDDVMAFGGDKVRFDFAVPATLELLAGKDGAQGWVDVPTGHWLVCQPGDKSDIWPVEGSYFRAKYTPRP